MIVVAHALRDAGMEVVYLGHATPDQLVAAVIQEDPALVGLSSLSGNHLEECRSGARRAAGGGVEEVPVVLGGTVPPADEPALAEMGVSAVFGSGSPLHTIRIIEPDRDEAPRGLVDNGLGPRSGGRCSPPRPSR